MTRREMSEQEFELRPKDRILSKFQLRCMYDYFWNQPRGFVLPLKRALEINQGTFDSLAERLYLEHKRSLRGFRCTPFGWFIKRQWDQTNVLNSHPARQFGSYLRAQEALSGTFDDRTGIYEIPNKHRPNKHHRSKRKAA